MSRGQRSGSSPMSLSPGHLLQLFFLDHQTHGVILSTVKTQSPPNNTTYAHPHLSEQARLSLPIQPVPVNRKKDGTNSLRNAPRNSSLESSHHPRRLHQDACRAHAAQYGRQILGQDKGSRSTGEQRHTPHLPWLETA